MDEYRGRRASSGRPVRRAGARIALALALLLLTLACTTTLASAATATFGTSTVGALSQADGANLKGVGKYALPVAGTLSSLSIYLQPTGTAGQQSFTGVLYADSAGVPGALLGTTSTLSFTSTDAAGWYQLTLPTALALAAGNYWIGFISGTTSEIAAFRYATVASGLDYNANTFTSGPSNPFGTPIVISDQISLYGTYTPTGTPPTARPANTGLPKISGSAQTGQTLSAGTGSWSQEPTGYAYLWERCNAAGTGCVAITGATSPTYTVGAADIGSTLEVSVTASNSLGPSLAAIAAHTAAVSATPATFGTSTVGPTAESDPANFKGALRYALPAAGAVSKLSLYLQPTGTAGTELVKGAIYADSSGAPGALLGSTNALTFTNTSTAGWYELAFPTALKLAPGNYWIGFISGGTAYIAAFRYASATSALDYNANTYTSGASNPFGTATTGGLELSLYATYTPSAPAPAPPAITTPPVIYGNPQTGATLSVGPGSWTGSPSTYSYKWERCNSTGAECSSIADTTPLYRLATADLGSTLRAIVTASNSEGPSQPATAAQSATITAPSANQHLEYVFEDGLISVYSMDDAFKLVKTISLPQTDTGIRGISVDPKTHLLFISYGGDGEAEFPGSVLAYNLVSEKVVWTVNLKTGIDSGALNPAGTLLYEPTGENNYSGIWNILSTANGEVLGTIQGGAGAHNTIVSADGRYVYLGGRYLNYFDVYDTTTGLVHSVGPLINGVRPFTVNGSNTLAFTTETEFDGFQVSSLTTGKVLSTVEFALVPPTLPDSGPSHGISLSPNESQLAVIDDVNREVRFYNVAKAAEGAQPTLEGVVPVSGLTATKEEELCAYDCKQGGWIQRSIDGRYIFVGDSGEVIETATRKIVTLLPTLANTKKSIEVEWAGGVPIASSGRQGVGEVG